MMMVIANSPLEVRLGSYLVCQATINNLFTYLRRRPSALRSSATAPDVRTTVMSCTRTKTNTKTRYNI